MFKDYCIEVAIEDGEELHRFLTRAGHNFTSPARDALFYQKEYRLIHMGNRIALTWYGTPITYKTLTSITSKAFLDKYNIPVLDLSMIQ